MSIETFFAAISSAFVPVMAALILAYGLLHNAPVYDYFIEGAKKGLATALEILPFLIGDLIWLCNGLTASGLLQFIYQLLAPLLDFLAVPSQLLPLMLLRAVSGSGSFILVQDILEEVGPDSYAGRAACVMAGGCETVIYVLALYFSVTGVTRMRHAFACGMLAYLAGIARLSGHCPLDLKFVIIP